jgi:ATP-dependent helicase YprA (DUF1998 family)
VTSIVAYSLASTSELDNKGSSSLSDTIGGTIDGKLWKVSSDVDLGRTVHESDFLQHQAHSKKTNYDLSSFFPSSSPSSSLASLPAVMIIEDTDEYDNHNNGCNPHCCCDLPSVVFTSHKERSFGKAFYKCPKSQCNFFEWKDGDPVEMNYEVNIASMSLKDPKKELFRRFGHRDFRKGQEECVEAALKDKDVYCLMPTGGGKSIVYQLPAWCNRGLSIVFSPLISLIQDQVDAMNAIGIRYMGFIA